MIVSLYSNADNVLFGILKCAFAYAWWNMSVGWICHGLYLIEWWSNAVRAIRTFYETQYTCASSRERNNKMLFPSFGILFSWHLPNCFCCSWWFLFRTEWWMWLILYARISSVAYYFGSIHIFFLFPLFLFLFFSFSAIHLLLSFSIVEKLISSSAFLLSDE